MRPKPWSQIRSPVGPAIGGARCVAPVGEAAHLDAVACRHQKIAVGLSGEPLRAVMRIGGAAAQ